MAHVVHVVADGALGGGTTHVLQLIRGMGGDIHSSAVTAPGSPLAAELVRLDVPVEAVEFFGRRGFATAPAALTRSLRRLAPDLIHVHGVRAGRALVPPALRGVPIVYTIHGFHHLRLNPLRAALTSRLHRKVIGRSDATVFVCEHDRLVAGALGLIPDGSRTHVVHNAAPGGLLAEGPSPPPTWDVAFVGRMVWQKHPELFVETLRRLPGASGVMVGGGPLSGRVEEMIRTGGMGSRVTLMGPLPHAETLQVLRRSRIAMMTSRHEGLPILCCECAALGVPMVACDVGGTSEIVRTGVSGVIVRDPDPDQLAEAVSGVLGDAATLRRMSEAARAIADAELREADMVERILGVYGALDARFAGVRRPLAGPA